MAESQPIIVSHCRHFIRHLEICNPICVELFQIMFSVIPRNLKEKRRLYRKPFSCGPHTRHTHTHKHIYTHTDTHDDSIRRNAMHCISPKNLQSAQHFWLRLIVYRPQEYCQLAYVFYNKPFSTERLFIYYIYCV